MIIIGITGGSGVGKSAVLDCFLKLGAAGIDADKIYHDLTKNSIAMLAEITEEFGQEVINADGSINRKELGSIVFSNARLLHKLNDITHKYITDVATLLMLKHKENGYKVCAYDAAILFDAHTDNFCDKVIGVIARRDKRIERIVARDGVSREYAALRIDAQKSDEFYKEKCDYIIENNTTIEKLYISASKTYSELTNLNF